MKKLTCLVLTLLLTLSFACAETVRMGFEDGFSLALPADWQYYEVSDALAADGVIYCLSDAAGEKWLHIRHWDGACTIVEELHGLVREKEQPEISGIYSFNGVDCVVYDLEDANESCCAALIDGKIIHFTFSPKSDDAYMLLAADILAGLSLI